MASTLGWETLVWARGMLPSCRGVAGVEHTGAIAAGNDRRGGLKWSVIPA
jgi:hypothetical protein